MSLYEYIGRIKRRFPDWCEHGYGWSRETKQMADSIRDMLNEYDFEMSKEKPSDPPQPPEMPECVAKLLRWGDQYMATEDRMRYLAPIEDHYAKPLKLEVGKVYEDGNGDKTEIVHERIGEIFRFLGVHPSRGKATNWFDQFGSHTSGVASLKLIREVKP